MENYSHWHSHIKASYAKINAVAIKVVLKLFRSKNSAMGICSSYARIFAVTYSMFKIILEVQIQPGAYTNVKLLCSHNCYNHTECLEVVKKYKY